MATSIPPHNVGELIDAAMHLIDNPKADDRGADGLRRRARISRPAACWSTSRETHRRAPMPPAAARSACARAIEVEREKGGGWHLLVSEIPYGVQKAKLIEQIAAADRRQEAADPRRRQGRERRAGPAGARAARAHGRSRPAARKPVPADRPRDPLPAQPQRARRDPHAGRDEPQGGAARLARLPDRGAGPPLARCGSARSTTGSSCSTAS